MNSPQRILITGSNGLLGQKVTGLFASSDEYDVLATHKSHELTLKNASCGFMYLDISNRKSVRDVIRNFEPDVVINCAAMTHVDKCESERDICWQINAEGVRYQAEMCKSLDIRLIHVSTDYVFDGKSGPYAEDARVNPISYYGKSKLASENAIVAAGIRHVILRTMVVYGLGIGTKSNFALWLVNELKNNRPVRIVTDQLGNATLVEDLAEAIYRSVRKQVQGIYNAAGCDILSRYEFARLLARVFGYDEGLINPILTSDLNQPAPRPLNSGLLTLKAESELGMKFSSSEEGLIRFKQQLKNAGII